MGGVVRDLAAQDIWAWLADRGEFGEVVVLANGCRDGTAARASEAARDVRTPGVTVRVFDLTAPGKSRTWNAFVHRHSDPAAGLLFFCDGDIVLPDRGTLRVMAEFMARESRAMVGTSRPTKDLELREPRGLLEVLSRSVARLSQGVARHAIAGSLYCARRELAGRVEMPVGLLGEDGYMRLAASTMGFREAPDDFRVERVPGAMHVFSPCKTAREYLDHERRLVMGTVQNFAVWDWIRSLPPGSDAAEGVRSRNEAEDGWSVALMRRSFEQTGWRALVRRVLARRLTEWRMQRWRSRLVLLPAVLAKAGLGCAATVLAYRQAISGNVRW